MPQTPPQTRSTNAPLLEILKSPRVSAPTRSVLERRLAGPPADYKPTCISPEAFQILERVLGHLLPDDENGAPGANELSLAARLEQQRAAGHGNGWRYASLPPDAQAIVNTEFGAAAMAERADIAKLNTDVRDTLEHHGLVFNDVDPAPFREALKQAGFYKEWRGKYGEDAWRVLEEAVGTVS